MTLRPHAEAQLDAAIDCCNNGLVLRPAAVGGTVGALEWDACTCDKGKAFAAALDKGIADIEAGRSHPLHEPLIVECACTAHDCPELAEGTDLCLACKHNACVLDEG